MIGIIVNPRARRGKDPGLPGRLEQVIRAHRAEDRCELVVTPDLSALCEAAAGFARRGVTLVGTCGGDGTTMAVLTALHQAYGAYGARLPRLFILRGGTVNTVARNLHLRGSPERVLDQVLAACAGPRGEAGLPVWEQDLVRVRSRRDAGPRADGAWDEEHHGCLFAAAMGARFLQTYYALPRQGIGWATMLVLRTVGSTAVGGALARRLFAETEARLEVDGEELPAGGFRLFLAATVADVGLGMRVTWQAGRSPGRFHMVASRLPLSAMARQLPRVLSGAPLSSPEEAVHVDRLACALRLRFPAPQPYTLDGDLFTASEVAVDIGPRLQVVRPG